MPTLDIAASIPLLEAAVVLDSTVEDLAIAASLPLMTAAIEIEAATINGADIAASLPLMTAAIAIGEHQSMVIAGTLPRMTGKVLIKNRPRVQSISGTTRQNGGGILMFVGQPNRNVEWAITVGTGTLYPLSPYTDASGRAYCRLDPGSFTGTIRVEVTFVP